MCFQKKIWKLHEGKKRSNLNLYVKEFKKSICKKVSIGASVKKQLYAIFLWIGSTASRLQSHYEETFTFSHVVPRISWNSFDPARRR